MRSKRLSALIAVLVFVSIVAGACTPAQPADTAAPPSVATQPASSSGGSTQAACAAADPSFNPASADVGTKSITVAFEQEPDQLTGQFSIMSFAGWLWQTITAGPGRWDDKNNLVPYMATQIPSTENGGVSADGLTVTWKLKPCLFWSDGQPITSKDFAFTWKANVDPANAPVSRAGWDKVASIDTPDDQTLVIHFKEVYPAWPLLFDVGPNNTQSGLLPAHILEGKTALEKDPEIHQPTVAAGPFAVKEWVAGDHLTLVRNPNFFGDRPKLDSIQVKFVPDPETGLAALKTGDVDFMVNLAESDIEAVNALAPNGIHLRVDPTPQFEHLLFNLGTTTGQNINGKVVGVSEVNGFCPFKDVNVRKAITLGIDRLSFIKNYLKEDEKAFIATLWPNSYWTDTSLQPYPYDPTQANQLLDAAGYKAGPDGIRAGTCDGKPVKFSLGLESTNAQRRVDDMTAIQADLKKIGIDVKPNPVPAGTFFGSYTEGADMPLGKFDMAIYTTGFYPDPDPSDNFLCSGIPTKDNPTGQNNYHICDPKLESLFAQGLATSDPAARKKVYDQVQQYMYDNALIVPLYARANVFAYDDRFIFPPSSGYANAFWDAENFDVKQ